MNPERALRGDVALANRIIERLGLSGAFGHVSARLPGTDRFLLPSRRSPRFASDEALLVLDCDGNVLETCPPDQGCDPNGGCVPHAPPQQRL